MIDDATESTDDIDTTDDGPPPPCAAWGLYDDIEAETEEQANVRWARIRESVGPKREGYTTFILFTGGLSGGLSFTSTPLQFESLWMLEGAKIMWAVQAKDWNEANTLYHRFMGWAPYIPMGDYDDADDTASTGATR